MPKNHIKHPQCNFKQNTLDARTDIVIKTFSMEFFSIILHQLRNTFSSNG